MNKFGRSQPLGSRLKGVRVLPAPSTIPLTKDGDYNLHNHKLCNVKSPDGPTDAANKEFVESILMTHTIQMKQALSNIEQKFNKSLDDNHNKMGTDSVFNKTYVDGLIKELRTIVNDVNNRTTKSLRTVNAGLRVDRLACEGRFKTIDVKLDTLKTEEQKAIDGLTQQVDKLKKSLKTDMDTSTQNSLKPILADIEAIKTEVLQQREIVHKIKNTKI